MIKRKVSQKTIADLLGVSQRSVSKALNGEPDVSETLRKRVESISRELGYQKNALARSLIEGKSGIIGALTVRSIGQYYHTIWDTLEEEILQNGYTPFILRAGYDAKADERIVQSLVRYQIDGLIVSPVHPAWQKDFLQEYIRCGNAVVFIGVTEIPRVCQVSADDFNGAKDAVIHLNKLGHRHIAFFGAENSIGVLSPDRLGGYKAGLKACGLKFDGKLVIVYPSEAELGTQVMESLRSHPEITAFFCDTDQLALTLCDTIRRQGLSVPGDLSVIGFGNNLHYPEKQLVPLTTIAHDPVTISRTAVDKLLQAMAGNPDIGRTLVPNHLVVRASTASPRKHQLQLKG